MLDEHFMDEMNEIIRLCPVSRQTLLFSATMTDEVIMTIISMVTCLKYFVGGGVNKVELT